MSSFIVGPDHVDYLVSAAFVLAPDVPGIADRGPQELGMLLLRENIATTLGLRDWPDDALEPPMDDIDPEIDWEGRHAEYLAGPYYDEFEAEEIAEGWQWARQMLEAYVHRSVDEVDPVQAAVAAVCWQYQRGRNHSGEEPHSWKVVDAIRERALAAAPASAFADPANRSVNELLERKVADWVWRRPA